MKNVTKFAMFVLCLLAIWGCTPAEEKAEEQQTETKETTTLENGEGIAEVDGRQIHYEVVGEGPACVVLTNSWGLNYKPLKALFADLEDVLTLIYFDARGMGESSAVEVDEDMSMAAVRADAIAVLDHLGIDQAYVLGWSNGASNTYMFTGEHADRIKGAIALHGLETTTEEDQKIFQEKSQELGPMYAEYLQQMADPELTEAEKEQIHTDLYMKWFPMMLADQDKSLDDMNMVFADAMFSYKHAAFSSAENQNGFDATEMLKKVEDPMLIIAGDHDMAPVSSIKRSADLVENSTFVVFENSSHFAPIEEPEKFKQTVVEFINSTK